MSAWEKTLRVALSVLFAAAVALCSQAFTDTSSDWFQGLTPPTLMPPFAVFPIVWGVLSVLYAVSLSIVAIRSGGSGLRPVTTDPDGMPRRPELFPKNKPTLILYLTYGVLSVLWSYTFFILHNLTGALFVLIAIIVVTASVISSASRISPVAAALLLPGFVWLCFALYLNYEFAFLN
ncbi:MAG: TspO/MBR family protein [Christensenellales bacterium]|jgi:benzodiazapine receptor